MEETRHRSPDNHVRQTSEAALDGHVLDVAQGLRVTWWTLLETDSLGFVVEILLPCHSLGHVQGETSGGEHGKSRHGLRGRGRC